MTKWPRCNVRLNLLFISDQAVIEKLSIKPLVFSLLCTTEHLVHVRLIKAKRGDFTASSRRKPDSLCHEPYDLSISARFYSQFSLQPYVSYHHAAFLCCLFGGQTSDTGRSTKSAILLVTSRICSCPSCSLVCKAHFTLIKDVCRSTS